MYLDSELRSTNQFALFTTDTAREGSHTRSAYLVTTERRAPFTDEAGPWPARPPTLTIIDDLKFHLYLALPLTLDPHLLYEEMLLAYGNGNFSSRALDALRRDVATRRDELKALRAESGNEVALHYKELEQQVQRAKLVTFENQRALLSQYRQALRQIDAAGDTLVPELPPGAAKLRWMKEQLGAPGFFVIKAYAPYDISATAGLRRKKLKDSQTWRFTFDNHTVVQFFLKKFANPFEIGASYDSETEERVPGTLYPIYVLRDDSKDPELYVPATGDVRHMRYVQRQTQLFTQADYVYRWSWTDARTVRAGCVEPAFATGSGNINTLVDWRCADILARLDANSVPVQLDADQYRPSHCTLTFSLRDLAPSTLVHCVSLQTKKARLSLNASKKRSASVAALSPDAGGDGTAEKTRSTAAAKISLRPSGPKQQTMTAFCNKKQKVT